MCVTRVEMLKKRAVMTSYGDCGKENKKCLNLINMILKICRLIRAHNCCNLNWAIHMISGEVQKVDWIRCVLIVIFWLILCVLSSRSAEYIWCILYQHKCKSIMNVSFDNIYFHATSGKSMMSTACYKNGNNNDKCDNNKDKVCLLLRRWGLVDQILNHVLDHMLDHMLDYMLIRLVTMALQLLSFLA